VKFHHTQSVIPAEAESRDPEKDWIRACAGMTDKGKFGFFYETFNP
jgi:hypothetical protein